jgi:inhibitor of cysteine peptidase
VLILVLLTIASCTVAKETSPLGEVNIGPEDNGKRVEVNAGDTLRLSLPSHPTTGYRWEVVEIDEDVLRQVGEPEFQPESELLGAPGEQIFRFHAVGEGQAMLKLIYHRSWEKDVEPADTFRIQVAVH